MSLRRICDQCDNNIGGIDTPFLTGFAGTNKQFDLHTFCLASWWAVNEESFIAKRKPFNIGLALTG